MSTSTERTFDFETIDEVWLRSKPGRKWQQHEPRLAAWIADMDFAPAPQITAALNRIINRGDLGYANWSADTGGSIAVPAFIAKMRTDFGWSIEPQNIREWGDIVQAIQAILHVTTTPGDRVATHTPAYPPFFDSIAETKCELLSIPASTDDGVTVYDHDAFEEQLKKTPAKVLLLCNPQNPSGHCFTENELKHLIAIAERHDLLIVSDEIHSDLVYAPALHIPIATLPGAASRTITLNSASKAFNIASLRYAVSHCGAGWVDERLSSLPGHLLGVPNLIGAEAARAAWNDGGPWLTAVRHHLHKMRDTTLRLVAEHLPGVKMIKPDATYLAWLDCKNTPIANNPASSFRTAGVELNSGLRFGPGGEGFVRLNFATSTAMLTRIITIMSSAIK